MKNLTDQTIVVPGESRSPRSKFVQLKTTKNHVQVVFKLRMKKEDLFGLLLCLSPIVGGPVLGITYEALKNIFN